MGTVIKLWHKIKLIHNAGLSVSFVPVSVSDWPNGLKRVWTERHWLYWSDWNVLWMPLHMKPELEEKTRGSYSS